MWLLFEYQKKYKSVVTLISLFVFQMSFVPSLSPTRSMPSSSPPTSSYSVTRVSRGRSQTLRPVCLTAVLLLIITTKRTVPLIRKMTDTACCHKVHILPCHLNTCLKLGQKVFVHSHMPCQQCSVYTTKYLMNYWVIYLKAFWSEFTKI